MRLGYELVKEQLFFQKELIERAWWFIRLRWLAAGAVLMGSWAAFFFEPRVPVFPLTFISLSILVYNIVFHWVWHRIHSRVPQRVRSFEVFAHVQISMDLVALYGIVSFTGGIHSPLLIFVIFHIILAGILLSTVSCYTYGIMVAVATGSLLWFQEWGFLSSVPALFQNSLFPRNAEFAHLAVHYGLFVTAILITAFLTTSLKGTLRTKGREILHVSRDLEASNAKLTALYEMLKRMGLSTDLQELMDLATRNAARIMGVKACSIKLLDEDRKKLNFASAHGLSLDYVAKGSIDIDKSPINRKVIEGSFFSIGKIDEMDYFQYPEDIRREGIASMICLPLRVEKMAIGVFCVYSEVSHHFDEEDIRFFSLMSDLIALAIETLRSEINKTWFLRKAAHQLRSPFTAIYSMLKVLGGGYLGTLNKEQKEMVLRCIRRIEMLGDLINDLLKLGIKRVEADKARIHPVDGGSIMNSLATLFQSQAQEKRVEVSFTVEETLPQIMGDERLVDELFTNLISNAMKYTPPGGRVRVFLGKENQNWVRLEVADTGIGVPEEDQHRLFTEFFRAENAKALVEEGTGLGLVIVKEILDHLGGTISFESKVGQGTKIRCLLPAI
ncbi:MAG: GAF domain-containing protein [Deltaproteobacteria bacterium]|nr:GAF domain-containing protein [Deltaproteobacteria bacterium]